MSSDLGGQADQARTVLDTVPELSRLLLDLTRCPNCSAALRGPHCAACGIDLTGPDGGHLQRLSRDAAAALDRRESVLQYLRAQIRPTTAPAAPTNPVTSTSPAVFTNPATLTGPADVTNPGAPANPATSAGPAASADPAASPRPATSTDPAPSADPVPPTDPVPATSPAARVAPGLPAPDHGAPVNDARTIAPNASLTTPGTPSSIPTAPETRATPQTTPTASSSIGSATSAPWGTWSDPADAPRPQLGVNTILVGVGALLLAVAAIGFLIFSWQSMPLAARAAVIATATLAALGVAAWLRPRLPETAEAVGALGVVLVLGDGWAIRRTGLFGADHPHAALYTGTALLVSGLITGLWGRVGHLRAGTHASTVLLPIGTLLTVGQSLNNALDRFVISWSLALAVSAAVTLLRRTLPPECRTERLLARALAATMLVVATVPALLGLPDPDLALLTLLCTTVTLAAQTWADKTTDVRDQVLPHSSGEVLPDHEQRWGTPTSPRAGGAPSHPTSAGTLSRRPDPLGLNRVWSLATGISATAAAAVAGLAVTESLSLSSDIPVLIAVTLLTGLLLIAVSRLTPAPRSALRRTALALGVLGTYALIAVPTLVLVIAQVVRPVVQTPRSVDATARLDTLGITPDHPTLTWAVTLACLAVLAAVTWVAARGHARPAGPWPRQVRRTLRQAPPALLALFALVLTLVPAAAVVTTVTALLAIAVAASVLAIRGDRNPLPSPVLWMFSALLGTLAATLAWTTHELPGVVTTLAVPALLAARRRVTDDGPDGRTGRAGLALLAFSLAPVALGILLDQANAGSPLFWLAVIGPLVSLALITVPRLPLPERRGRATWTPADRLAAAAPGYLVLGIGLATTLDTGNQPAWHQPVLLAVTALAATGGTLWARAGLTRTVPLLTPVFAAVIAPAVALFLHSWAHAGSFDALTPALIWALTAAAGALLVTALVLRGRLDGQPPRRAGAEAGLAITAIAALALSMAPGQEEQLWLILLIVGAAVTAIALTPGRSQIGWVAGLLLTASSWTRLVDADVSLVEAYTVPPALVLLGIQLWARHLRPAAAGNDRLIITPLTLGLVPSVITCLVRDDIARPIALMTLAALVVAGCTYLIRTDTTDSVPAWLGGGSVVRPALLAGTITAVATALARVVFGLSDQGAPGTDSGLSFGILEVWTIPAALIALLHGLDRFPQLEDRIRRHPQNDLPGNLPAPLPASWSAFSRGLVLLLGPGLLCTLTGTEGPHLRPFLVILLAAAVAALGAQQHLQAVLVLGSATLAIEALVLLSPWMTEIGATVPLWAWAAVVGLALLVLGGGYERRLAQLRSVRSRIAALR
ncbi:hypothetical protein GCM10022223_12480 [Kineosporia mesophila]|uniref:Uncharacterized protein n=1 Tax=Kineosporia mesophila TaxID=566012 RepID=A0ABP6ZAH6_9ACTN|nr:hypothetical protein [Kineosporia mesophila]MCD5352723.1 hypothetical protein [Kineosporia mesophila]